MTYRYEGHDALGRPRVGTVEAATPEDAAELVRHEHHIFAMKIEPHSSTPMTTVLEHKQDVREPGQDVQDSGKCREPDKGAAPCPLHHVEVADWKAGLEKDLKAISDVVAHARGLDREAKGIKLAMAPSLDRAADRLVTEAVARAASLRFKEI